MKITDEMIKEAIDIDNEMWKKYRPDEKEDTDIPNDYRAVMYLQSDIEHILVDKNTEEWGEYVGCFLNKMSSELNEAMELNKIKKTVAIRKNWTLALRNVRKGTALSPLIGWGLSAGDIKELATLHKKNKFRKKIEDLLEDCNFHYECGAFMEGKYAEFVN